MSAVQRAAELGTEQGIRAAKSGRTPWFIGYRYERGDFIALLTRVNISTPDADDSFDAWDAYHVMARSVVASYRNAFLKECNAENLDTERW